MDRKASRSTVKSKHSLLLYTSTLSYAIGLGVKSCAPLIMIVAEVSKQVFQKIVHSNGSYQARTLPPLSAYTRQPKSDPGTRIRHSASYLHFSFVCAFWPRVYLTACESFVLMSSYGFRKGLANHDTNLRESFSTAQAIAASRLSQPRSVGHLP